MGDGQGDVPWPATPVGAAGHGVEVCVQGVHRALAGEFGIAARLHLHAGNDADAEVARLPDLHGHAEEASRLDVVAHRLVQRRGEFEVFEGATTARHVDGGDDQQPDGVAGSGRR